MRVHLRQGIFSFLLVVIFLSVPVYWLVTYNGASKWSEAEERFLPAFPRLSSEGFKKALMQLNQGNLKESGSIFIDSFFNDQYRLTFMDAAPQNFPLRSRLIYLAKFFERAQINLAYALLPDEAIPTDMQSGLFILKDKSVIIERPYEYTNSTNLQIDARIKCYEDLLTRYPDIDFYAYFVEPVGVSVYNPLNLRFPRPDQGQSYQYFLQHKPERLLVEKTEYADFKHYVETHFRTDHHWNIFGALEGYDDIYRMLSSNYQQISPPVNHDEFFVFPDINFLGSRARQSLYPITPDEFAVAIVELPPYEKYVNGVLTSEGSEKYLKGDYQTSKYFDHHSAFHQVGNPGLIYYDFNNNSKRNLLIIGNSQKKPIQALLASHYKHTYSIDLRSYNDFSFSDFVEDNPVDDVLFIGNRAVVFMDGWSVCQ